MNQTIPIVIAAILVAVALDIGLMQLLRGIFSDEKKAQHATFLGDYSPLLTWLRYRRLPRAQLKSPLITVRPVSAAVAGLGLALFLAGISQWQLLVYPSQPGWPLFGYAVSALIFLWISRRSLPIGPASSFAVMMPQRRSNRTTAAVILFSLSAVAGLFTILQVDRWTTAPRDFVPVMTWWASLLLFSAAVLVLVEWRWPARERVSVWWRSHWREATLVAGLFVWALAVRTVDLPWFPYAMMNDEGEVGKAALAIMNGLTTNMFRTGWSSQPIWSFLPDVLTIAFLGNSLLAVRLVSAMEGALAVVLLYLFAREAFGREVALLAALGLAGLAWHIHFSRLGVNNIIDSLLAAAVFWLTYRAMRHGRLTDYLVAGLLTGLTVYTYVGSRLALVLALGLLAFGFLRRSLRLKEQALHLGVYLGAVILVAGPMMAHFIRYPDEFMARTNAVNMLIGGRLEQLAQASAQSIPEVLLTQFTRSTLVYVTGSAPAQFFFSPRPYLPWLAAMFFILGLAYATWRAREPRYMAICLWLWLVVIFGSTLTSAPPSNQRLIMSAPAVTLLVAIGLWQTVRLAHRLKALSYKAGFALTLVAVCVISLQGIVFYFGEYRSGHYSENTSEEFSYEVALKAHELGPDYRLFVIGLPTLTTGAGNFGYLAADIAKSDYNTVTPETLNSLPRDKGAFFAAVPVRLSDLEKISQWIPGGQWSKVQRRFQPDQVAYYTYLVDPDRMKTLSPNFKSGMSPYAEVLDSPDGRYSARLRVNWDRPDEKPVIELWDQKTSSLLWKITYQYPKVDPTSMLTVFGWSPDSSSVYFYYTYNYNAWYTIFKGSSLQSLNARTGEVKDIVAGCCVDFVFSPDMKKIAYTSGDKVGLLDLVTGSNQSAEILPHDFEQAGRIFLSPAGDKVVFHTFSNFRGTAIILDAHTMKQKVILDNYLFVNYEFDGWTADENPRYRNGNEVFVVNLSTLSQTLIGTATPAP